MSIGFDYVLMSKKTHYVTSRIKAITPAAKGAEAEVPPKVEVHSSFEVPLKPIKSVVTMLFPGMPLLGAETTNMEHDSLYQACSPEASTAAMEIVHLELAHPS